MNAKKLGMHKSFDSILVRLKEFHDITERPREVVSIPYWFD